MTVAPRAVLDTNVWLDLLHFRDPRAAALEQALYDGHVVAVIDEACRDEWRRVLRYAPLQLDDVQRAALEKALDARCMQVGPAVAPDVLLPRCRDGDDQKFIELAHRTGARWLVSRDRELLALARRMAREGRADIVTPEGWRLVQDD